MFVLRTGIMDKKAKKQGVKEKFLHALGKNLSKGRSLVPFGLRVVNFDLAQTLFSENKGDFRKV